MGTVAKRGSYTRSLSAFTLGWISIATIAKHYRFAGIPGMERLGIAGCILGFPMIAAGTGLALLMLWKRKDIFYCAVIVWALFGIYLKHTQEFFSQYGVVITFAIAGMFITGIAAIISLVVGKRKFNF